ncbi:MAG: hypothetical protein AAGE37_00005 [Pseudomonadota bacterium]
MTAGHAKILLAEKEAHLDGVNETLDKIGRTHINPKNQALVTESYLRIKATLQSEREVLLDLIAKTAE